MKRIKDIILIRSHCPDMIEMLKIVELLTIKIEPATS